MENKSGIKIGVIIQGPVITYGQGPNNKPEGFNCEDTILKNIENIRKNGFAYILSTWKTQNNDEKKILEDLRKAEALITENDTPTVFDPDHRHKQRVSILFGIEKLDHQKSVDYFVKIRTDMLMPESFWLWIKESAEKNKHVLSVSELWSMPFYMGDFIYAAPKDIFIDFVDSIVKHKGRIIHPAIAFDDGVKYAEQKGYFTFQKKHFQNIYICYLFSFRRKFIQTLWNTFIAENLQVLPEEIWNAIFWRGRRMGSLLNSSDFKFDTSPLNANITFGQAFRHVLNNYVKYWKKGNTHRIMTLLLRALEKGFQIKAKFIFLFKKSDGKEK